MPDHTPLFPAPSTVLERFLPFSRPDYIEGMLIGNDLDSLLSAMYLQRRYGWPLEGIYCAYSRLFHYPPQPVWTDHFQSGRLIAVDLDIYHPSISSIGHHIVALQDGETLDGRTLSINPNEIRGISNARFRMKYPLSTLHFLMWIFEDYPTDPVVETLLWLCDSSWLNARQYRSNTRDWLENQLRWQAGTQGMEWALSDQFEHRFRQDVAPVLASNPLALPPRSKKKGGYQCQFEDPGAQHEVLTDLLARLSSLTGWPPLFVPPIAAGQYEFCRTDVTVSDLQLQGLTFAAWLDRERVFSYAFTYADTLNFSRAL